MQDTYISDYNYRHDPSFGGPLPDEELTKEDKEFWGRLYDCLITDDALPSGGQDHNASVAPDFELPPPEVYNYGVNQWDASDVGQTYEYEVPHQYVVPYTREHDSSYAGYLPSLSYSTRRELDASNSQTRLQENHIGFGMPTFDIPQNGVMQQFQEPGYPPAYGTDQFFTPGTVSSEIIYTPNSLPVLPSAVTNSDPISFSNPPQTVPSQSFQPLPIRTAVPVPQHQKQQQMPSKKQRNPKPKKGAITPSAPHLPSKTRTGRQRKGPAKSQEWLDKYFAAGGNCRLCTGGSADGRPRRLLEHLVSVHCIQAMKNMQWFDESKLADRAKTMYHFVTTEAIFEYTRKHMDAIGCSLCTKDSSLVFRSEIIGNHLRSKAHRNLDKATRDKEEKRLKDLEEEEMSKGFHNLNDKFLYHFPGGMP